MNTRKGPGRNISMHAQSLLILDILRNITEKLRPFNIGGSHLNAVTADCGLQAIMKGKVKDTITPKPEYTGFGKSLCI